MTALSGHILSKRSFLAAAAALVGITGSGMVAVRELSGLFARSPYDAANEQLKGRDAPDERADKADASSYSHAAGRAYIEALYTLWRFARLDRERDMIGPPPPAIMQDCREAIRIIDDFINETARSKKPGRLAVVKSYNPHGAPFLLNYGALKARCMSSAGASIAAKPYSPG